MPCEWMFIACAIVAAVYGLVGGILLGRVRRSEPRTSRRRKENNHWISGLSRVGVRWTRLLAGCSPCSTV